MRRGVVGLLSLLCACGSVRAQEDALLPDATLADTREASSIDARSEVAPEPSSEPAGEGGVDALEELSFVDSGCSGARRVCDGVCVDTLADPANCGACGMLCGVPGTACVGGSCACRPENTCGADCFDLQTDPFHCGACGTACDASSVCTAGRCVRCPAGQVSCNNACVDTRTDLEHCGGCFRPCGNLTSCVAGSCVCPAPRSFCGALCVDTRRDDLHCGACDTVCGAGTLCVAGSCVPCTTTVRFSTQVEPLLAARCTGSGCHQGSAPPAGLDLTAGASYAHLVGAAQPLCPGQQNAVPGVAAASAVLQAVLGEGDCGLERMPLGGPPLAQSEVDLLRGWLCEGAPRE